MKKLNLFWIILYVSNSNAQINLDEDISVSGFGTVSAAASDTDIPVFSYRDISNSLCLDCDTTFGLQADWLINEHLRTSAQVVKRPQDEFSDPVVEWAFVDYSMGSTSIKVGRLRLPMFNLSEFLYVSSAYSSLRAPHDVYDGALGITHYDGATIEWDKLLNDHIQLRLAPFVMAPMVNSYPWYGYKFDLESKTSYGMTADLYSDDNTLHFTYLSSNAKRTENFLPAREYDLNLFAIGATYVLGNYNWSAETMLEQEIYATWYVSVSRRLGSFEPYLQYGQRRKLYDNETYLVGLRYDLNPRVKFNLEWEHIEATPGPFVGHFTQAQDPGGPIETQVNVYSVGMSFTF
jgi:hypothetical protein